MLIVKLKINLKNISTCYEEVFFRTKRNRNENDQRWLTFQFE